MNNRINKRGITLVTLAIMIVIMIILASAVVASVVSISNNSKTVALATDLSNIEQAVEGYYLENNELPKITVPIEYTKSSEIPENNLITLSGENGTKLGTEIDANGDTTDKFFEVDLSKIKINSSVRGIKKNGDKSDIYVVDSRSLKIYYVKGYKIGNDTYFSLTDKLVKSSNIQRVAESTNDIGLTVETDGIKIIKSKKGWINTLDISVSSAVSSDEKLRYSLAGTTAIDIVGNSLGLKLDETTMTTAGAVVNFTRVDNPDKTFVVEKIKISNGEVIAKAIMNINNLDIQKPMNGLIPTVVASSFSDFNTVTLTDVSDLGGSNIKEIRYEYNEKYKSVGVAEPYFSTPINIDETYLKTNGQKITSNILKLNKNIKSIKMIWVDSAGNTSTVRDIIINDSILVVEKEIIYKDGYVQTGVNPPSLISEVGKIVTIPVIFNNDYTNGRSGWVIADVKTKWYEYLGTLDNFLTDNISSKWANVVLVDSSQTVIKDKYYDSKNVLKIGTPIESADITGMYVWIPRYAYKIRSGVHTTTNSQIDLNFISGTGTGGAKTIESELTYTGTTQNEYYVHPAFRFAGVEKTGFWMSKFELGGTTGTLKVAPAIASLRMSTVKTFFEDIRSMEKNGIYGWIPLNGALTTTTGLIASDTNTFDIHMIKNMEWGAVTYLTQSRYGRNGHSIDANIDGVYTTGGSDSLQNIYSINALQSTTGNSYGVYDMVGGSYDVTIAYLGSTTTTTASGYLAGTMSTQLDSRYYDDYTNSTGNVLRGSSVYETSLDTITWGDTPCSFPTPASAWIARGGFGANSCNIFTYTFSNGSATIGKTTRPTLYVN